MFDIKKLVASGVFKFIPYLSVLIFNFLLARWFSFAELGPFFYWLSIIYLSQFIGKFGIDIFLLKELPSGHYTLAVSTSKTFIFLISLFTVPLFLIFNHNENLFFLILSYPFFLIVSYNSVILRAEGKDYLSGLIDISFIYLISLVITIAFSFFYSINDLTIISKIFFFASIATFCLSEKVLNKEHKFKFNKLSKHAIPILKSYEYCFTPLIIYGTQWLPVFFLNELSSSSVTIYTLSVRLSAGVSFILIAVDAYLAPRFAKLYYLSDFEGIEFLKKKVAQYGTYLILFILIIYFLVGKYFLMALLGNQIDSIYLSTLFLILSYSGHFIFGPNQNLFIVGGAVKTVNTINLFSFLVALVGTGILYLNAIDNPCYFASIIFFSRFTSVAIMAYMNESVYMNMVKNGKN